MKNVNLGTYAALFAAGLVESKDYDFDVKKGTGELKGGDDIDDAINKLREMRKNNQDTLKSLSKAAGVDPSDLNNLLNSIAFGNTVAFTMLLSKEN